MQPISILLVEDDASLGAATLLLLQSYARRVTWTRDVSTAVAELCAQQTSPWDLMLLDLDLNGERGESVIQLAQRDACGIPPIVVVSAQPMEECQQRATLMGATAVLRKPARADQLIETVRRVVQTHQIN